MESKHEIPGIMETIKNQAERIASLEAVLKAANESLSLVDKSNHAMRLELAEARSQIEALTKDRDFAQGRATAHAITIGRLEAQLADYGKPVKVDSAEYMTAPYRSQASRDFCNHIIASRTQSRQGAPMSERSAGE